MNRKQTVFFFAKAGFSVLAIGLLFRKASLAHVCASIYNARHTPVVLGIFLCLSTIVIAGWRWQRLLGVFGIQIRLRSLVCIAQIGQFFLMFLPGPTGDDLTRMLYISRLTKGRVAEACTSVLIDRMIGLAAVLVLAVLCIPWQWQALSASRASYWLAIGISAVGTAVLLLGLLFFLHRGFFLRNISDWCLQLLPASKIKVELLRINSLVYSHKKNLAQVLSAALFTQVLLCGVFYLAGLAVGIHMPFVLWLGFVPIVLAANAVPITIAGLGVREYLMVLFLGVLAHIEAEQALAASLVAFSMMLANSLLGGLVYILYRPVASTIQLNHKEPGTGN
ncbi:MAG: lysylphosphatidylglycerol synthase transmembrane domain-containing protein [Methylacidiphilales bacterium]|nr:lysylphosphatidylglycerol synthase transmembrane domain-containing protein [Candidatus Methylacidiphilales bacterium]